jgi:hypothetical protein
MEAELATLDTTIMEADWLHELLMDLPIVEKPVPAILMNYDNQMVKGQYEVIKTHQKMITVYQEMRNSRVITLDYIHIEKNLIDLFTKGLSHNMIDGASKEIGLRTT